MSRGPGRWQRAVLELVDAAELEDDGLPQGVTTAEVVAHVLSVAPCDQLATWGNTYGRAAIEAARRAMRTLARKGLVTLHRDLVRRERAGFFRDWRWVAVMVARRPLTADEELIEADRFEWAAEQTRNIEHRAGMVAKSEEARARAQIRSLDAR